MASLLLTQYWPQLSGSGFFSEVLSLEDVHLSDIHAGINFLFRFLSSLPIAVVKDVVEEITKEMEMDDFGNNAVQTTHN